MDFNFKDYEVWFVTGSQHLYGEEALRQVGEDAEKVAKSLGERPEIPVTVVYKPVSYTHLVLAKAKDRILVKLTEEAAKVDPTTTTVVALDWLNGRRTPFADQELKGALVGLTLGTDAPRIFRALVEATAFGAKAIVDRFREEGVAVSYTHLDVYKRQP